MGVAVRDFLEFIFTKPLEFGVLRFFGKWKSYAAAFSYFPIWPNTGRIIDFRKNDFSRNTMLAMHSESFLSANVYEVKCYFYK